MKSMLEREKNFTPVTASVVDRHVLARGSQEKVINNIARKDREEKPDLVVLTPTCTSSILQEDLKNFVHRASFNTLSDVVLADINHYRFNELQAADKTLLQIVSFYLQKFNLSGQLSQARTKKPSVNIIGCVSLGFHSQHDVAELKRLFLDLGIDVNLIIPEGVSVKQLSQVTKAWFNFVPYREIGVLTAEYLQQNYNMPFINIVPIGITQMQQCIVSIQTMVQNLGYHVNYAEYIKRQTRFISQSAWFSRSIDCQNLTGKKAIVFGDSTHASAITRILASEMSIKVVWSGTYCLHDADWFKNEVSHLCDQVIISDDHTLIADLITKTEPDAIFGTQMERHIGKRLSIPCGVISSPVHIQNFPLSYKPFLGYEGTNQIADLIYNSFTLGMEDHLLEIFGGHDTRFSSDDSSDDSSDVQMVSRWSNEALQELSKIPGFVRGRVRKNTEKFADANDIREISLSVMYEAKEANKT